MENDGRHYLTPLKEVLASLFKDRDLPFRLEDAHIWKIWDEVVGPAVSHHAQPAWIKAGRLRVHVSDSIWLQELSFQGEVIREKLNQKLDRIAVNRIEFRMGALPRPSDEVSEQKPGF